MFKELKTGYPLYIYDRNNVSIHQPKIINVSIPHIDNNNPQRYNMMNMGMVVDITVDCEGSQKTYTLSENGDVAYKDNIVIATDKGSIVREIEAAKSQAEQLISQVEANKERLEKYNSLLAEFNPIFKEKKETEERFVKIESSVSDIKGMMSEILKELKGK
jgi:hypothetical protein